MTERRKFQLGWALFWIFLLGLGLYKAHYPEKVQSLDQKYSFLD